MGQLDLFVFLVISIVPLFLNWRRVLVFKSKNVFQWSVTGVKRSMGQDTEVGLIRNSKSLSGTHIIYDKAAVTAAIQRSSLWPVIDFVSNTWKGYIIIM